MNKRKAVALGLIIFILTLGVYLFFQPIHMPTWMTYPYDITIWKGNAIINAYLSEEKEVSIPDRILGVKVDAIDEDAFLNLGTNIIISSIPKDISYAYDLYDYKSQSYYRIWYKTVCFEEYTGNEKNIIIPEQVWGQNVTDISANCFMNTDVEEIAIPETVTYIGAGAFMGCKNLKQIELPTNLEEITPHIFRNSGIECIKLPSTVREIGKGAFEYSKLKEIIGLENIEYVNARAFRGTPWEESIEGDFVCINDVLYLYRGTQTEVVIPSTIKEIRGAFYKDDEYDYPISVTKVFIPESVTVISPESFAGQKDIEVYIPESVISLGDDYGNPLDQSKECIFKSRLDGIIVTTEGSPAETYAIEQRIPYRIITEKEMQQEMDAANHRINGNS